LVHTRWRATTDGKEDFEVTNEVVRLDDDGQWRYLIDNPQGPAILDGDQ